MGSGASQQSPSSPSHAAAVAYPPHAAAGAYPQTSQAPYYPQSMPPSYSSLANSTGRAPVAGSTDQPLHADFLPEYQNSQSPHVASQPQYGSTRSASLSDHSPPPSPAVPHTASYQLCQERVPVSSDETYSHRHRDPQIAMQQAIGVQDYALTNITRPTESCDLLLTDKDLREGDEFIREMEEKSVMSESVQVELLRRLQTSDPVTPDYSRRLCELITTLCELSHFLHAGTEDELGIEFLPAEDAEEDTYILEQLESITRRHHKELKESDKLCAEKLLEGRGSSMTEQRLDSILEEHIKLRSYMRTRQTKDQIDAYNKVLSSIQDNPSAFSRARKTMPNPEVIPPITSVAAHPIVNRLPPISQSKLRTIGATRGRTEVVDQYGHVVHSTSKSSDKYTTPVSRKYLRETPDRGSKLGHASDIDSTSTPSKMSSITESEGQEVKPPLFTDQQVSTSLSSFTVSKAGSQLEGPSKVSKYSHVEQASGEHKTNLVWSSAITKTFTADFREPRLNSHSEPSMAVPELKVNHEDDFENDDSGDDDDLLAQFQHIAGGANADGSSVATSLSLSDRPASVSQNSSDTGSEQDSIGDHKTLTASAKLNQEVSEAMWENQDELNPQTFHALINEWQSKQKHIAERRDEPDTTPTGRDLWKRAKEKVLNAASARVSPSHSDSEEEDLSGNNTPAMTSASGGTQTTVTEGTHSSVQTDAIKHGLDAATLVDEYLMDDQEQKKIRKKDQQLVKQLAREDLTDDEFRRLLANNRVNIEKLRKERELKRLTALRLLDEKKARRDQKEGWGSDEETNQKLDKIEEKLTNKLLKTRGKVGEKDMKNLLKDARRRQDEILRQRKIEKVRQSETVRAKLLEKKRAKAEEKDVSDEELTGLEDKFYKDLQQQLASGNLNQQRFKRLIEEHLSQMSSVASFAAPGARNHRNMEDSNEELAQFIIKQGDKKNKVIQDVRQRQRQNALTEVKQKRKLKKKT